MGSMQFLMKHLDMYAPGDGLRPVTKWVSFDDIGEVEDMITDLKKGG